MCGIVGFINGDDPLDDSGRRAVLKRMCRAVSHRGPDDEGLAVKRKAALGVRRLAIIDLVHGRQPMCNEDGSITVVFNGEIYNHKELRCELEPRGHRFQTASDTEVIVHAFEEYGVECVDHFRGMFAFAVWDTRTEELFAARDRVGEKPLYYTVTPRGSLVFGSELKSLLEHPGVQPELCLEALDAYLTLGYVPQPLSIFRGIYKLQGGHYMRFVDRHLSIKQYWNFCYERGRPEKEEEYLEELRALLDESVRLRLASDVPVGLFLSGGLDSSTVLAFMARHSTKRLKTFSVGFHEQQYNESQYAQLVASHFGAEHEEFIFTPGICDLASKLVWHLDEPFTDLSSIPTYMLSKLARGQVTVALSGDGGDELFAGYTRYITHHKRRNFSYIPRLLRHGMMQPISRYLPHGAWGRNYLHNVALDPIDRYTDSVSVFTALGRRSLYTSDFRQQLNVEGAISARMNNYAGQVHTDSPLDPLLYIDSKTYLPDDILTKADRMGMAASIEVRMPLLDHKLIEFVTRIPAGLKLKGFKTKHIFKQAVTGLLPPEILNRTKQGFEVPFRQWINREMGDHIREVLTDGKSLARGYFNAPYIHLLIDEHRRSRRDNTMQLWSLFMLELWHRSVYDGVAYSGT